MQARSATPSQRRIIVLAVLLGLAVLAVVFFWPDDPEALLERALASRHADPALAEALLTRSILAADGDFPDAQLALSGLLADQGRWAEAHEVFHRIHNPAPCELRHLIRLADAAQQAGHLPLAEAALAAGVKQSASDPELLRKLIALRVRLGREDLALEDCRRLARLEPGDPFPWVMEARIYRATRQVFQAQDAYRRALEKADSSEQRGIRSELVGVLLESRNVAEARTEFDKLIARPPLSPELRLQHAHLLRLESRPEEAIRAVNELLERGGDSVAPLMLRGEIKLDLKDYSGAAEDLEQVVRHSPLNKEAHYKLAMAYRGMGDRRRAESHLEKSRTLGELSTTAVALEQQASLEPDNVAIPMRLAEMYDRLGNSQRANYWRARARPGQ
jgi:Flp pilus assembly protein TadD